MSVTHLFIARHGQTEYNLASRIQGRGVNESLNQKGQEQARAIGAYLQGSGINHIFCSSLKRSQETADLIAELLELPVEPYPELDEMDFGTIEGKVIAEIHEDLVNLHNQWRSGQTAFAVAEGESPEEVLERSMQRIDSLLQNFSGQLLFVLHGRLIRILLSHMLGYGLSKMHLIEHENGALYHLVLKEDGSVQSIYLNNTEHLAGVI